MKRILKQLGQLMFRYRKKIIYGALAVFVGQICFLGIGNIGLNNKVLADDGGNTTQNADTQKKISGRLETGKFFQKVIYVIIYPILLVVGKLVDNSLVYGEVFGFDTILWQLWIMVRNIANFALGFIFIFYIFKYLITQDSKHGPKWLIIRSVIAGVGIQASWFIMAALIDISTILTYGVGGLPISVLGTVSNSSDNYNPYVLKTVISADSSDIDTLNVYLSNPDETKFISECKTYSFSVSGNNEGTRNNRSDLIVARQMIYYKTGGVGGTCYPTEEMWCHIGDQVYKFGAVDFSGHSVVPSSGGCGNREQSQIAYNHALDGRITSIESQTESDLRDYIRDGKILQFGLTGDGLFGLDEGSENIGRDRSSPRMNDILSGGYVGVFTALYGSLLNAGKDLRVTETNSNSIYISFLNIMISLGHMIAIGIPLIAMAVVFMIRICVLRLAISLSPIIILLKVFEFEKIYEKSKVSFLKYFQVKNLIGIIFSPAIVCFAISMSTVLVRLINSLPPLQVIEKTPILGGLVELNLGGMGVNLGRMIMSVLGIAITRFLVWAAVKASAIGESKVIGSLENLAKTTLGSIPVIPVPTKEGTQWVGKNAVFGRDGEGGIISKMSNKFINEYNTQSTEALEGLIDPDALKKKAAEKAEKQKVNKYIETVKNLNLTDYSNWINTIESITKDENGKDVKATFATLSPAQKNDVIKAINEIEDVDKRKKLGDAAPSIIVEGKTWKFKNDKYE